MRGTKLIVDCFVLRDGLKKLQIIKCVSQYNWGVEMHLLSMHGI